MTDMYHEKQFSAIITFIRGTFYKVNTNTQHLHIPLLEIKKTEIHLIIEMHFMTNGLKKLDFLIY